MILLHVIHGYVLINCYYIKILYICCRKIYNLFVRALETDRKARFSSLFHSEYKLILYLQIVNVQKCTYIVFIL
jgi:hypothetical protein